jgi:hypothetical protein
MSGSSLLVTVNALRGRFGRRAMSEPTTIQPVAQARWSMP